MADLFTDSDLADRLQIELVDLKAAAADTARRTASGWLRAATGLADWPDPVPDDLWAWGLELGVMVYINPEQVEELQVGGVSSTFGLNRLRIQQILDTAHDAYWAAPSSLAIGNFPDAKPWPDPPYTDWRLDRAVAYLWWLEA